jgi:transcriptional regulator with XRE-family HTH domain
MHCGDALKAVMARKGCSGVELAKKLGKHPQQISRWRKQKRFSITTILSLSEALEIDPQEFLR